MNKVIDLDPRLSPDERNLLSFGYKSVTDGFRNGIRMIDALIDHEKSNDNTNGVDVLRQYSATILEKLKKYSQKKDKNLEEINIKGKKKENAKLLK